MKTQLKIEKRIQEELDGIRKIAELLPAGKRHAVLNKCSAIFGYARKAQAMVDASFRVKPTRAISTPTRISRPGGTPRRPSFFEAMTRGRKLSLENEEEFKTREMHTQMCIIRREIESKNLPWVLCDEEVRPDPKRRGYKRYWLIPKEDA